MNDRTNSLDYKNISLMLAGEISSACINRNNLTQPIKQSTVSFPDNMEDDDEQFILNLKKNIDKNYKMQNKESFSLKNLQNKPFSLKKKKSVFSDENQNLMKRFKKSVDESKALDITPQKLQKLQNVNYNNNDNNSMPTATPLLTSAVALNNVDMNLRNKANQFFFQVTSKLQKNDQMITPANIKTVTETEIEQLIYYEMHCLTPPRTIH
ncbi:PREDICTED: DNA repair protein RAD50-like [Dinoponera quadriceps]|uniref:DNA repair protein RAD50-like n=1 Tax=Dinoponera quadriceps TaxID=609295 RepID=A0A6P3XB41_DINQU|nr:PREDICTED: DNA repair protein RAD50-like [Dinoponera quadriceps]